MKRYALIQGGYVANVVEQGGPPQIPGEWVECGKAGPGWSLDGGVFAPPVTPPVTPRPRHITQFAFRCRVGDDFVAQMELAAMHNGADAPPVQIGKARRRAAMARLGFARWLDLDSAELRAGLERTSAADLARIFDAPVRDDERP